MRGVDMEIRLVSGDAIRECLEISRTQLGDGYLKPEDFSRNQGIALVAALGGRVRGFCLSRILTPGESADPCRRIGDPGIGMRLEAASCLGLLATVAVAQEATGAGIGTCLMQRSLAMLEDAGCDAVILTAWRRPNRKANLAGIAERLGFQALAEIPDYWSQDSLRLGYECPECGRPPCRCSAVIYGLF